MQLFQNFVLQYYLASVNKEASSISFYEVSEGEIALMEGTNE